MKTAKYYRQMKVVVLGTILMSIFWIYWTMGRSINMFVSGDVPLRDGYEAIQISLIVGYCVFAFGLIVVQMIFLFLQLKGLKKGILFDRALVKYLVIWGVLWLFYDFASGNIGQMVINSAFNEIVIPGTMIGIPAIVFTFAILYKMAADVSEENSLTI